MPKTLTLAAIRMDAAPAPTESRLERAEKLVAQAAAQGAQIAVLPEVFNSINKEPAPKSQNIQ